jgi:hypothetical protein
MERHTASTVRDEDESLILDVHSLCGWWGRGASSSRWGFGRSLDLPSLRRQVSDSESVALVWQVHAGRFVCEVHSSGIGVGPLDVELRAWLQEPHDVVGMQSDLRDR